MKIKSNFDNLWLQVKKMGDFEVVFDNTIVLDGDFETDKKLSSTEGLDIELEEISTDNGVLSYKDRQVLLFIPDQGRDIEDVLLSKKDGRRFHVADCVTLNEMRAKKRFNRYKATYNTSGVFDVYGTAYGAAESIKGQANLKICKNCLKYLNYKGYATGNNKVPHFKIFNEFDIAEFLSEYSTIFKSMPTRSQMVEEGGYAKDWVGISKTYRESKNYCCEECNVSLIGYPRLLHTHHIDGNKQVNTYDNLKALCIDCHRKQPHHDYMRVSWDDMNLLTQLRRDQGILDSSSWIKVRSLADKALEGLILYYEKQGYDLPEVGYELVGSKGAVECELELAWPKSKKGVVVNEQTLLSGSKLGWNLMSVGDAIKEMNPNNQGNRYR